MAKFAAKDSNKNITLSPHGTGKVVVGTGATDATVQSDGNHNLVLQTGNSTTGSISITDGANGDIAISPNGTGTVVVNTDLDVDNINVNGNAITSTNTDGNIDLTPNGTGEVNISKVDIDGGAIDGVTIGTNSVATDIRVDNLKLDGNTISSTDTNGDIDISPNGTGSIDINSGTLDLRGQTVNVTLEDAVDAVNFSKVGGHNTLSIDATNNRVGVSTASPSHVLEVEQTATSGMGLLVHRNLASGSTDNCVAKIHQNNASDDQAAFVVRQDGTGDLISLEDDGTEVFKVSASGAITTPNTGTFDGTIGSNATFQDGIIVDQTIIKYAFGSSSSYTHSNTSLRVVTRKSSSDSAVENINVNAGHTYIYEYVGFCQAYAGATIQRVIQIDLYDDDTTKSQGDSTLNGRLATAYLGRELNANGTTFATSQGNFKIVGASYYASDDERFIYLGTKSFNSAMTAALHMGSSSELYLKITKIKGNILTTRT